MIKTTFMRAKAGERVEERRGSENVCERVERVGERRRK